MGSEHVANLQGDLSTVVVTNGDVGQSDVAAHKVTLPNSPAGFVSDVKEVQSHKFMKVNGFDSDEDEAGSGKKMSKSRKTVMLEQQAKKTSEFRQTLAVLGSNVGDTKKMMVLGILAIVLLLGANFAITVASLEMTKEAHVRRPSKYSYPVLTSVDQNNEEDPVPMGTTPTYQRVQSQDYELTLDWFRNLKVVEYFDGENVYIRSEVQSLAAVPCPVEKDHQLSFYCSSTEDRSRLWLVEGDHYSFVALNQADPETGKKGVRFLRISDPEILDKVHDASDDVHVRRALESWHGILVTAGLLCQMMPGMGTIIGAGLLGAAAACDAW
eukprot:CAMPEP_0197846490 /NCGR_PEP_ID=MMETSP1438-20131217/3223_1 /TAXON_ID=1461541 /ORGANISM="Pterosperma sp., Strain CCMP1384" /LENGTH=325 /DNA_ID=CAMNT_0043458161 /DNA_START=135 /DNA_END=1109 /DNA_ORIENTATION=-